VNEYEPAIGTVLPTCVPLIYTMTIPVASAVPLIIIVLVVAPFAGVVTVGFVGGVASTVNVFVLLCGEVLPALSAPASAVPVIVVILLLIKEPVVGFEMIGDVGAVESTVNDLAVCGDLLLFASDAFA
jgi:hypothetical protein